MSDDKLRKRLELACRRVYGNPDSRTADQQIVYDHLVWTAKQDAGAPVDGFQTNPMMMNIGVTGFIWKLLEMADKDPLEEPKQTTIKTTDNDSNDRES